MPLAVTVTRVSRRLLDALLVLLVALVLGALVIARVVPLLTGGATFVVGGGSMVPAIPVGAAVIVTPVPASDLRPGDVVSLRVGPAQAIFTHRIARLVSRDDGLWLETRGDANPEPDPSLVPADAVIGRFAVAIPVAGYVVALMSAVPGLVFLLSLAGFLLAAAWLLESVEDGRRPDRRRPAAVGRADRVADATAGQGTGG